MALLKRSEAAKELGISVRTLDRLRRDGVIPWVDVAGGTGLKPIVRVDSETVAAHKQRFRQCAA